MMRFSRPRPACLFAPLRIIPASLLDAAVGQIATFVLKEALQDGELDALLGQVLLVELHEPRIDLRLTVRDGAIRPARGKAAVTISANAEDLLLVMAQRSDPDTLFFQRRLALSGDTALGLTIKNVLDTVAYEGIPEQLLPILNRLADAVPQG